MDAVFPVEDMNNVSIQGDPAYINYQFDFYTFPVLTALLPWTYLGPTIAVQLKILLMYLKNRAAPNKDEVLNMDVFFVIVVSQIASSCYMLADFFSIRLPSTGIMTSWCAAREPSHFLKLFFFFSVYFNYPVMLFPFLISVLRLVPLYFPTKHSMLTARIVRFCVPSIFVYPLLFTFFLIPALGFCVQLLGPYRFGAIYFYYSGSWFKMRVARGLVFNSMFWLTACIIANSVLYSKVKKLWNNRHSSRLRRAEISLFLTTLSMLLSCLTNLVFLIIYLIEPGLAYYFIGIRPFGNDFDTVFAPWIFYLTHPAFKRAPMFTCLLIERVRPIPTN